MPVQIPVSSDTFHCLTLCDIVLGLSLAKLIWQKDVSPDLIQQLPEPANNLTAGELAPWMKK